MGSKKEKPWVKVFVYGTLMTGCALHGWLRDPQWARKIRDAEIYGYALLSLGPYPALIKVGDCFDGGVRGELWELHPDLFAELSSMERKVGYSTETLTTYNVREGLEKNITADATAFVFATLNDKAVVKWNVTKAQPSPKQQIIEVKG